MPVTDRRDRAVGAAVDELVEVGVAGGVHRLDRAAPADAAVVQHRDVVGDGADRGHVVGDGDRGRAHLGDELADQLVDDVGQDRVEAGGRLVEEDHLGVGGDGAGEADALLHAARELGRVEVGGLGAEADAGELRDRELAGRPRAERVAAGVDQPEGDVLPDRQAVEERAALEQHAEVAEQGAAVDAGERRAVDQDLARVVGRGCRGCTSASPTCRCPSRR